MARTKEFSAAQCQTREDCRGSKKRMGEVGYQCVCDDRGEQVGCLSHNRTEKQSKGHDFMETFNVRCASCLSSTAEKGSGCMEI